MKPKPTHGGSRKGAGRKPSRSGRKAILLEVMPATQSALKVRKKVLGVSSLGAVLDHDYSREPIKLGLMTVEEYKRSKPIA